MTSTVILVGADKGGVGKTMVSRVLLDYLNVRGRKVRAFDSQYPGGDLVRFYSTAKIIDLSTIKDQMEVFDTVDGDVLTVVDLCAGWLTPTIRALDDAKLLEEVRAGRMSLVLLHVLGPTIASIGEIASAAEAVGGGAKHLLVKNHASDAHYFDWDNDPGAKPIFDGMADVTINVSQLDQMICETLQKRGGTFLDFIQDPSKSRVQRGRVRSWLEKVWGEFDRVKVVENV